MSARYSCFLTVLFNFKLAKATKTSLNCEALCCWLSSDDEEDGREEATGIFEAVMSSANKNVGGFEEGSLVVGRRRRRTRL